MMFQTPLDLIMSLPSPGGRATSKGRGRLGQTLEQLRASAEKMPRTTPRPPPLPQDFRYMQQVAVQTSPRRSREVFEPEESEYEEEEPGRETHNTGRKMEQTETLEAWMLGLCRFAPSSCLAINRCWRTAALKFVSEIKLFAATLDLALHAISQRPHLQRLDASKCKSLHSDDALKQLSAVLRGMGPKVRPFLRPGEGLQHLYLGKATGLTPTSCQCLQRLGLQWWAFHSPPSRGSLLVSRPLFPSAGQPELIRSVVLVLQHDSRGSKGMLLNKPSKLEVELDPAGELDDGFSMGI
eukprot:symbB.v1.2.020388.t7/scaffold1706.1/size105289/2